MYSAMIETDTVAHSKHQVLIACNMTPGSIKRSTNLVNMKNMIIITNCQSIIYSLYLCRVMVLVHSKYILLVIFNIKWNQGRNAHIFFFLFFCKEENLKVKLSFIYIASSYRTKEQEDGFSSY
jgi:hypothetical protein